MKNLPNNSLRTSSLSTLILLLFSATFGICQTASVGDFQALVSYWSNPADLDHSHVTMSSEIKSISDEKRLLIQKRKYEVKLNSLKSTITDQYNTSNWKEARKSLFAFFDMAKVDDEDYDYFQYLYGSTSINMEDYGTALEVLSKLLLNNDLDTVVKHNVEFDLALVTMIVNQEDSLRLFSSIAQNFESPYHREAKSIIERY